MPHEREIVEKIYYRKTKQKKNQATISSTSEGCSLDYAENHKMPVKFITCGDTDRDQ